MGKKILAVIAGYVVMAAFIFITFTLAYVAMGTEGAFQVGTYEVSGLWILASIALGFIAAVIGGIVCFVISKSHKTSMVLAGIVLALGLLMAIPTFSQPQQAMTREADVSAMDAMNRASQPTWLALLNPLIGAAGVIVGTRMWKQKQQPSK